MGSFPGKVCVVAVLHHDLCPVALLRLPMNFSHARHKKHCVTAHRRQIYRDFTMEFPREILPFITLVSGRIFTSRASSVSPPPPSHRDSTNNNNDWLGLAGGLGVAGDTAVWYWQFTSQLWSIIGA